MPLVQPELSRYVNTQQTKQVTGEVRPEMVMPTQPYLSRAEQMIRDERLLEREFWMSKVTHRIFIKIR